MDSPTLVAGRRAPANLQTGREDYEYMTKIAMLPLHKHPAVLITLGMRMLNTGTSNFYHFDDQPLPEYTTINGTFTSGQTAIVVDESGIFVKGNQAILEHSAGPENVLITDIDYTTHTLTVVREYGVAEGWTSTKAAVVDGIYVKRAGGAYMQGHTFPTTVSTKVNRRTGYVQDWRTAIDFTDIAAATRVRGTADWDHQKNKGEALHYDEMEKIFFWNKPYAGSQLKYDSSVGNTLPTMSTGLEHELVVNNNTNLLKDETELTMWELIEYYEKVFAQGANQKVHYVPSSFFTALDKWGITKVNTVMEQKIFGMRFLKWVRSPDKVIMFKEHDMMAAPSTTLYNKTFVVDHEYLGLVFFNGTYGGQPLNGRTKWMPRLGYKKLAGETATKQEIRTIFGLLLRLADCHGRLRYKTIGA